MELRYFFFILFKRKWLLLTVIIAAAAATAFVVGLLPKKYKSSSVIETGLIDYKSVRAVGEANPFIQEFEIELTPKGTFYEIEMVSGTQETELYYDSQGKRTENTNEDR